MAPNEEIVTATADGVRKQSYLETRNRSHQLAHALRDSGIEVGDRIGTFMWNGSRHLEAYHACAGMGAVLHTLNIRLSDRDLEYIIGHAQDKAIIVDADALPLLEQLKGRMPSVERIIVATEEGFEGWDTGLLPLLITKNLFLENRLSMIGRSWTRTRRLGCVTPAVPLAIRKEWNMSTARSICTRWPCV